MHPSTRGGLILLSLALAWGAPAIAQPAAPSSLQPALQAIERLPASQRAQRLERLQNLPVEAGSAEALERLYQQGMALGLEGGLDSLAPLRAEWPAWASAAEPALRPLGELARRLVHSQALLQSSRLREAQQAWTLMSETELAALPAPWRQRALSQQARLLEDGGDLEAALPLRLDAITQAQRDADAWRLSDARFNLAYTHARLGQHERALEEVERLFQGLPADASDALRSRAHNMRAIALQGAGRDREALKDTEQSLALAERDGDRPTVALQMANLADGYLRVGDAQRALRLAEQAHQLATELRQVSTMSLALHNQGVALIRLGRLAEGKERVKRSITLELQSGSTAYASDGWRELGQYLEKAGDLAGATQAFEEHRKLADGLTRTDRRRALGEAQARFDMAQRQRDAELLQRQNAVREETIRAQRLRMALAAMAVASAAALAALLVMLARRLRRANAQLADANRELAAQSEVDPLTGLGNRRRLRQLLSEPEGPLQGTLLLLDIDHFKQLNDRFGHGGGDAVLQAVAGRLQRAVREPQRVMRWGGEEFLLYLADQDPALADALAQRLLAEIASEPVALRDGRNAAVTVSLGYAVFPVPGGGAAPASERAVDLVDALMYQAKSHGRNQAWGLLGSPLNDAGALRNAVSELHAAEADGRLLLQRWPAPRGEAA